VQAYVYKSLRKADTYVYLGARDDFARLPEPLRTQLGNLQFVLEVTLTPERKLARDDVAVVRENLVARGFHLQFPHTLEAPSVDKLRAFGIKDEDWGTDV
jgi:uncharacterized protein YcgL (UPF0745 family)